MTKAHAVFLAFITGLTALIYQVYGFQVLSLFFMQTSMTAGLSTSSFLFGMAFSARIFSNIATKKNASVILLVLNMAMLVYAQCILRNYNWIPQIISAISDDIVSPYWKEILKIANYWIYLFIPAFCIGSIFPIISGLYIEPTKIFKDTGTLYFWDTLGAGVGALITGFILIPLLGLVRTIDIALFLNVLIIACLALILNSRPLWRIAVVCVLTGVGLFTAVKLVPNSQERIINGFLVNDVMLNDRFGTVIFREPSPFGLVTVGEKDGRTMLYINYREMCRTQWESDEVFASNLIADETVRHIKRGNVLNIGLGCGFTAQYIAKHPDIRQVDVVEINPVVLKAASTVFAKYNHHVTKNKKLHITIQDGAEYLKATSRHYDAIVMDIEEVSVVYSSPLYTKEYFQLMKSKLHTGGVVSLWSFAVGLEFDRTLYNTLKAVFPYVRVQYWNGAVNFYASTRPINLEFASQREAELISQNTITHINTMDHRMLEKFYNSNSNFNLPSDYKEEFVR